MLERYCIECSVSYRETGNAIYHAEHDCEGRLYQLEVLTPFHVLHARHSFQNIKKELGLLKIIRRMASHCWCQKPGLTI